MPSSGGSLSAGPRVLSAKDFPAHKEMAAWNLAVKMLDAEGINLASVRAAGGSARGYLTSVLECAQRLVVSRSLPLPPPPRKTLPFPPGA